MQKTKYLFIDRDGTLIHEPEDEQIDSLSKFRLEPHVIPALLQLQTAGYQLIMVSNQDGLGTDSFPQADFDAPHALLLDILKSQDIHFHSIKICPHLPADNCHCRKPALGLVLDFLKAGNIDLENSYVIGDRDSDKALAENMGVPYILYGNPHNWQDIVDTLVNHPRKAEIARETNETCIAIQVNLDKPQPVKIHTGIGFFDHMLEQLAKHSGMSLVVSTQGDLHIDEHHTVEDTALALGQALRQALGDKLGINRYGFLLPMDEAQCQVALDLSGRAYFVFNGEFKRESVGELSTEMISHFFRSLAEGMQATLHITVEGENTHHMVESMFKAVGRSLKQAMTRQGFDLPTTKGLL